MKASSLAACGLVALLGTPVQAQRPECPAGNLLAGLRPVGVRQVAGDDARMTDGRIAPEGAAWDVPPAVVLDSPAATLTWDLGGEREVGGLLLQGDGNDSFPLSGSLDGRAFTPLGEIQALTDATGLRTRTQILSNPVKIRFLRLEPPDGDGFASVAEIALFCELPRPWPPELPVEPVALPEPGLLSSWNDLSSRWWELMLALLGISLLTADAQREKQEGAPPRRSWRRRLFAAAAVVAGLTWFNFGAFHFGNFLHSWDTVHYYLGAKYFGELSYDRLYECIAVADAEEPRLVRRVERRKITNLRTNVLEGTEEILAHPERCTDHFSSERWRQFTADVAWFRVREAPLRWEEISTDHGFNGTPIWLIAGSWLANLSPGPASERQVLALTLIDPLYFLGLVAVIGWAFGLRGLAVALLVFATFFPSRFFWTGGSFLRWDWLFYTAAAVACLKKGRPWLGGMALGYAALLRIFPGLLAAGPAVAVLSLILRDGLKAGLRRPEVKAHLRFLGGAALATALLVPLSLTVTGGPDAYRAFVTNTRKHQATPLTNYMGLRTVMTYRPAEVGRHLIDATGSDPWQRWKEARLAAWRQVRPFAALIIAAALVLIGRAARRRPEPWIAAALGTLWIAFAVELTSYYYMFILVPALLWVEKRSVGIALLALTAFSQLVSLPVLNMPTWRDEQYTLISLATIVVFGGILIAFALTPAAQRPSPPAPLPRERGEKQRRSKSPPSPGGWVGDGRGGRGGEVGRGKAPATMIFGVAPVSWTLYPLG